MKARVDEIARWLSPSRDAAIVRAVETMRSSLVIANGASDDAVKAYVMVLKPFPEPVIEDVCRRHMEGRLGGRVYAPTPAEVAHECRLAVADALAERGRIALILDAEIYQVPTEAERAEVQRRHDAFVKETARAADARVSSKPLPSAAEREEAERDLAHRKAIVQAEAQTDAQP